MHGYRGSKENFLKALVSDQILYAPQSSHVLEFWKIRSESHVNYIFYEDMKRNLSDIVESVADFLGKKITPKQVSTLCEHLSFNSMKSNESCNYDDLLGLVKIAIKNYEKVDENFQFIRKGQVGSFKEELSVEENLQLEEYSRNPEFKKFGFAFKFS